MSTGLEWEHDIAGRKPNLALVRDTGLEPILNRKLQTGLEPLSKWLTDQGVNFTTGTFVSGIDFGPTPGRITANALQFIKDGVKTTVEVDQGDLVMVTNGFQLTDMSVGSMESPPHPHSDKTHNSWALWKSLARGRNEFGHPEVFTDHIDQSRWVSFTVTCTDSAFAGLMEEFSGREAGRGGLMTFKRSNWLLTVVRFHQPNFIGQPEGTYVGWGYGIYPERTGNFVQKPMTDCTGAEILQEVLAHFGLQSQADAIIRSSICIPCLLPFASSVCLVRKKADRPAVVPKGSTNFAFIGQFCEQPDDVIFTMEYSVRSAWLTVVVEVAAVGRYPLPRSRWESHYWLELENYYWPDWSWSPIVSRSPAVMAEAERVGLQ